MPEQVSLSWLESSPVNDDGVREAPRAAGAGGSGGGGDNRRVVFGKREIRVGRAPDNDLVLTKGNVSKHHARLLYEDGRYVVTDLNSTNGTYVNRERINQATDVGPGDRIYIGDYVLRIQGPEDR